MIGLLVRETIALIRARDCAHDWQKTPECKDGEQGEEQCLKCAIIATPAGKKHLERMADRHHGRRPSEEQKP